jgi:hypothetical protein
MLYKLSYSPSLYEETHAKSICIVPEYLRATRDSYLNTSLFALSTRILQFQHEDRTLSTPYEIEEEKLTEVIEKCPFVSCQYAAP